MGHTYICFQWSLDHLILASEGSPLCFALKEERVWRSLPLTVQNRWRSNRRLERCHLPSLLMNPQLTWYIHCTFAFSATILFRLYPNPAIKFLLWHKSMNKISPLYILPCPPNSKLPTDVGDQKQEKPSPPYSCAKKAAVTQGDPWMGGSGVLNRISFSVHFPACSPVDSRVRKVNVFCFLCFCSSRHGVV